MAQDDTDKTPSPPEAQTDETGKKKPEEKPPSSTEPTPIITDYASL